MTVEHLNQGLFENLQQPASSAARAESHSIEIGEELSKKKRHSRRQKTERGKRSVHKPVTNPRGSLGRRFNWTTISAMTSTLVAGAAVLMSCNANRVATEQARMIAQGQNQERFDRAMEQLGNESITTRTGAVLALDRLVADANEFQTPTEELLARFIRDRAPLSTCQQPQPTPSDVQAALTTIGRHHAGPGKWSTSYPLDLRYTCLARADLTGADFTRANFAGTDLSSTVLHGTNFAGTYLLNTRLTKAQLMGTSFRCAVLAIPDFTKAWLLDVDMSRARIISPDFTEALFSAVNFHSAILTGVYVTPTQKKGVLNGNLEGKGCFPPDDYGFGFVY